MIATTERSTVAVSKAHGTLQEYRLEPTAALAEKAATLAESADDWRKARPVGTSKDKMASP